MTKEEIRFQVALSCIQGVLEAKHGIIGEALPSLAVAESLRIADEFVKQWFDKTAKPVELSEKDEKIRQTMIQYFTELKEYCHTRSIIPQHYDDIIAYLERQKEPRDYRKLHEEVVKSDWFKENYAGKFLGEEQKPANATQTDANKNANAEWGKKDEEMLDATIDIVQNSLYEPLCPREEMLAWLTSLRSNPSWKPNEYTLSLVKKVANGEMLTQMEQMTMGTLYDELQKLL